MILESILLRLINEGRLEDAKKKYPDHEIAIQTLADNDPSGNLKYLLWASRQIATDPTVNVNELTQLIKAFHSNASRLPKKDINAYRDIQELYNAILDANSKPTKKAASKIVASDTRKVYEDETVLVVSPLSAESSCKYGANTKWCVSATKGANYYDRYRHNGIILYFFIDKRDGKKYAASITRGMDILDNRAELFDQEDQRISWKTIFDIFGDDRVNAIAEKIRNDVVDYPKSPKDLFLDVALPTNDRINALLKISDPNVRSDVVLSLRRESQEFIQALLNLGDDSVTEAIARASQIKLSQEQINAMLNNSSDAVRVALFSFRADMIPESYLLDALDNKSLDANQANIIVKHTLSANFIRKAAELYPTDEMRTHILLNRNAPQDILMQYAQSSLSGIDESSLWKSYTLPKVIAHPNCPPELIDQVLSLATSSRLAAIRLLDNHVLEELVRTKDLSFAAIDQLVQIFAVSPFNSKVANLFLIPLVKYQTVGGRSFITLVNVIIEDLRNTPRPWDSMAAKYDPVSFQLLLALIENDGITKKQLTYLSVIWDDFLNFVGAKPQDDDRFQFANRTDLLGRINKKIQAKVAANESRVQKTHILKEFITGVISLDKSIDKKVIIQHN